MPGIIYTVLSEERIYFIHRKEEEEEAKVAEEERCGGDMEFTGEYGGWLRTGRARVERSSLGCFIYKIKGYILY